MRYNQLYDYSDNISLIDNQEYETDYYALNDLSDLEPIAKIKKGGFFLFLLLAVNIGWMLYVGTGTVRSSRIPFWVALLPIITTWFLLFPPAMFNHYLAMSLSLNRLALVWFLAGTVTSLAYHPDPKNGFLRIIGFVIMAMISYILLPGAYSWDKILKTFRWVLILGAGISLALSIPNSNEGGIFFNPNVMGFAAFVGIVSLGGALPRKSRYILFYIGLLLFFGVMLLASRSRISLVGAAVCGFLVFWRYKKNFSMWLVAIVVLMLMIMFSMTIEYRGTTLLESILYKSGRGGTLRAEDYTTGRVDIWRGMLTTRKGYEITGRGIGTMVSYYGEHPHSSYVTLWIELGYLGFPGFLLWIIVSIWQANKLRKYCNPQAAALTQNMFLLLVGIAVICIFEHFLGGVLGLPPFIFWITAGAISNALYSEQFC